MGATSNCWQRAQNPRGQVSYPLPERQVVFYLFYLLFVFIGCMVARSPREALPGPTPHGETGQGRHLLEGGPVTPAEVVCSWVHLGVTGN